MNAYKIRKGLVSAYFVFILVTVGFAGLLVFPGVDDDGSGAAATTRYVYPGASGPNNYTTIQAAIDNATAGDTIRVWAGTYNENVVVNKTVILIGNGTTNTSIDGKGSGDVILITANWTNVSGFKIKGSGDGNSGIKLNGVSNCTISNNSCLNNDYGIYLYKASTNYLIGNNISNNNVGIYLRSSLNNNITNNNFLNDGIFITGYWIEHWNTHTIPLNNLVNGKPVYYWKNLTTGTIPSGASQVILANCSNILVENQNCSYTTIGIRLGFSSNNTLRNNTCNSNNMNGISIFSSFDGNLVENNNCSYNNINGIGIGNSIRGTIENNTCNSNLNYGIACNIANCDYITNNTCASNNWSGISIFVSNVKNISNNTCVSNNGSGLLIEYSYSLSVSNNNISKNQDGMKLYQSFFITLINNSCNTNTVDGINVRDSGTGSVIFLDNNIVNNSIGINISSSKNCQIINQTKLNSTIYDIQLDSNSWLTVLNSTVNLSKINYVDKKSKLAVQWFMHVNVTNETGEPIPGANVTVKNKVSNVIYNSQTNNQGWCRWIVCTQYVENTTGIIGIVTPHNVTVKKPSYEDGFVLPLPNMTSTKIVNVTLYNETPPHPPTNLQFTNIGGTYLKFSWTTSASYDVEKYNIYINKTGSTNTFDFLGSTTDTFYTATKLVEETTYYFVITAYDDGYFESTNLTGQATTIDSTTPAPPTNLHVFSTGGTFVYLNWNPSPSPDVVSYELYVNDTGSTTSFHSLDITTNWNYNHTGLIEETTYYYSVRAVDDAQLNSTFADMISVTTLDITPPEAPTGLRTTNITGYTITLAWNANTEADLAGYNIYMVSNSIYYKLHTVPAANNSHTLTGLNNEMGYKFAITAFDEVPRESGYSDEIYAATLDITPPRAPTGLCAKAWEGRSIFLNWSTSSIAHGYHIYMNDTGSGVNDEFHIIHTGSYGDYRYTVSGLAEETTYHFKLQTFDGVPNNSSFSAVASATTMDETPPGPPTGLTAINIKADSVELQWKPNLEPDVIGYNILRSTSPSGPFYAPTPSLITDLSYTDFTVNELTIYYYCVKAVDDVHLSSEYSETLKVSTPLGQRMPEVNNSISDIEFDEDTVYDSLDLYQIFSDPNNDPLTFWCTGQTHINVTIDQEIGMVVFRPESNWNGEEEITFFACDEIFNRTAQLTIDVKVLGVNDPPGLVEIIKPEDNINIEHGMLLDFQANCTDPDLSYGDNLTFVWSTDITGVLGTGDTINDIILPVGSHLVFVTVSDRKGEKSVADIMVEVIKGDSIIDTDGDGLPNIWEWDNLGFDPNDPTDANEDLDSDGLTNLEEYNIGTDPKKSDSDDDGHDDGEDAYPLDHTKWKEKPPGKGGEDEGGNVALAAVVIILMILILLIFLFVIRPRIGAVLQDKDEKTAQTEQTQQTTTSVSIHQSLYPQHPKYPEQQQRTQPMPTQVKYCSTCKSPLNYIPLDQRYYCRSCKTYQ